MKLFWNHFFIGDIKTMDIFVHTLSELLKLKLADQLFIHQCHNVKSEATLIEDIKKNPKVRMLIRVAHVDEKVEVLCKKYEFDAYWNARYDECVSQITGQRREDIVTYIDPNTSSFDAFRGIYFFYEANKVRLHAQSQAIELSILKHAMTYNSIHAMKRYHEILFQNINNQLDTNESRTLLEIIENCKKMVPAYGSFARVMLAEAYCYSYLHFSKNNMLEKARYYYKMALSCCDWAEELLETSKYAIHNASFGSGLRASNTLAFGTIADIREYIEKSLPLIVDPGSNSDPRLFKSVMPLSSSQVSTDAKQKPSC